MGVVQTRNSTSTQLVLMALRCTPNTSLSSSSGTVTTFTTQLAQILSPSQSQITTSPTPMVLLLLRPQRAVAVHLISMRMVLSAWTICLVCLRPMVLLICHVQGQADEGCPCKLCGQNTA